MENYFDHDLELDAYLDLQHMDDSEFRCPDDDTVLKVIYTQNGPDDFYTSLICPKCLYKEEE